MRHASGLLLLAAMLLTVGCNKGGETTAKAAGNTKRGGGDVPVTLTKVVQKEVPIDLQIIGNVEAYSAVTVKAQVSGELTKVYFREGDYVRAGEQLFTIDARMTEAQMHQAEATLAKNQAQLRQAEANLAKDKAQAKYTASQANRYNELTKEGVLSKDQNDQAQTASDALAQTVNADAAAIESAKAEIASTRANMDNLRVMLGFAQIRSPINGRTGNINVKQGNIVSANTSDLATINQVQPIYVTFAVPESHLPAIKTYMARGKLKVFATPQDGGDQGEVGELTFVDNGVDPSTGTIKLKGTFANTDRKLWPGEFVRVVLRLATQPNALVLPNQAVQTGQDGPFVYVVKEDRTVESRKIVTGARVDQDLVIQSGLRPGETVVLEGQLRLAPGSRISVRDGRPAGAGGAQGRKRPKAE